VLTSISAQVRARARPTIFALHRAYARRPAAVSPSWREQAGHRAEYARVKRECNSKLVASLAQMGGERAYNHRLRACALARIDPGATGLQLGTMMQMMRTDAYSIKVELDRLELEQAKASNDNPMWNKLYQGKAPGKAQLSGHYTRFKVNAISKLNAAGREAGPMGVFGRKPRESDASSAAAPE
jgi:hypothetical protein